MLFRLNKVGRVGGVGDSVSRNRFDYYFTIPALNLLLHYPTRLPRYEIRGMNLVLLYPGREPNLHINSEGHLIAKF